jgi:hypothetical protein
VSEKKVPFYTQAAILDPYIHSSNPGSDPATLEVLLEMLRSRSNLRDYFFRSGPHAAWAIILWNYGFFNEPPSPQETEKGYIFPHWDIQEYLISVASHVPDVVLKHIKSIRGHGFYIAGAIEALCLIKAEKAEQAIPRIIEWLKDPQIANIIASQTYELIKKLAQEGKSSSAFDLFRDLTAPIAPSNVDKYNSLIQRSEAVSKFRGTLNEDEILAQTSELLFKLSAQRTVATLEENLYLAIRIEEKTKEIKDFKDFSWWRVAIEDTGQDLHYSYKDRLLQALRNALEAWIQQDAQAVKQLIQRYLSEDYEILRRFGLHLLHQYPAEYKDQLIQELLKNENLSDVGIHHEFFMLMTRGFPLLKNSDKATLIARICDGPPPDKEKELAEWAEKELGEDPDEYISRRAKFWIRDRLWILKDHLKGQKAKRLLEKLVSELGEPEHPEFTRWSSGPYWVREVSPIAEQELESKPADELVRFVIQWEPPQDKQFGPERLSYVGLASAVANIILTKPQKYVEQLVSIALHRSEFAYNLLHQFTKNEKARAVPWDLSIELCEKLLEDNMRRNSISREDGKNWVQARKYIVNLLQEGLNKPERAIPAKFLLRVRDILLILVNDPDPDPESEKPKDGLFGHNDPATIAINHVRPDALSALIDYAMYKAKLTDSSEEKSTAEKLSTRHLEEVVRDTLTRKLDRREDPSWAVHSIFGRYLSTLYWLDKKWIELHIDQIFPEEADEKSIWFFVAAWDSFVIFNRFHLPMLDMLYPKYEQAILNLSKGYVTQTHLEPERALANHLIWEYLHSDCDFQSYIKQRGLLVDFFDKTSPEHRGNVAWILLKILEHNPSELKTYWPKGRSLWEWRVKQASIANHPTDFDKEMEWFAHLPLQAPSSETLTSLWPLLEGLLPHITRSEFRNIGWRALEQYLGRVVEHEPVKAIQFYYLMHNQKIRPRWFYHRKEARKIIETAADRKESRKKALSLIDLLAYSGIHVYKDIYDRHGG